MTNVNVLERTSNLVLPTHYVELDRDEMSYVDGGGLFGKIFGTIGAIFAGVGTIVGGVCMLLVPEPTTLTKVGGIAAIVAGVGTLMGIAAIWDS